MSKLKTAIVLQNLDPVSKHENISDNSQNRTALVETCNKHNSKLLDLKYLERAYNRSDANLPSSNMQCPGCGAKFHSRVPGSAGFLALDEFQALHDISDRTSIVPKICVRCHLLKQYNTVLNTSYTYTDYEKLIVSEIDRHNDVVIIVVADMLNLPHSIVPLKLSTTLKRRRIILVGNKVDQLPIDSKNCTDRWKHALQDAFLRLSGVPSGQVLHVSLISALSGYGVVGLVNTLLSAKLDIKCPVYIVGSTNVGKSSLFNRLLLSNFCKSNAREMIHRATISKLPGTTMGMLKFPFVRMDSVKRGLRSEQLYHRNAPDEREPLEMFGYRILPRDPGDISNAPSMMTERIKKVQNKFPNLLDIPTYSLTPGKQSGQKEMQDTIEGSRFDRHSMFASHLGDAFAFETSGREDLDVGERLLVSGLIDARHFDADAWCFDTPGLETPEQVLNYLTPDQLSELEKVCSKRRGNLAQGQTARFLLPRSFVLRQGLSLLLGRLARVDIAKADGPVYLTTHSRLPVHIVEVSSLDEYLEEYGHCLGPGPKPNAELVSDAETCANICTGNLPHLKAVHFEAISLPSCQQADADVVLSGAGWVSLCGGLTERRETPGESPAIRRVDITAWTPGGMGISLRQPPLLPFAIRRRAGRILLTREFAGLKAEATFVKA